VPGAILRSGPHQGTKTKRGLAKPDEPESTQTTSLAAAAALGKHSLCRVRVLRWVARRSGAVRLRSFRAA
jgi:hypothetical protein